MLCITLTPVVECKSIFIIIIIMISSIVSIMIYFGKDFVRKIFLFLLHTISYFKRNYLEKAIVY